MLCDNFDVTLSDMQVLIADKGIVPVYNSKLWELLWPSLL
jgi:hypothetical protein